MPPKLRLDPSAFRAAPAHKAARETIEIIDAHIHRMCFTLSLLFILFKDTESFEVFPDEILQRCHWWMSTFEGSKPIRYEAHSEERYRDVIQASIGPTWSTSFRGYVFLQTEVEHSQGNWQNALDEIEYVCQLATQSGDCPLLGMVAWAPVDEGREAMLEYFDLVDKLPTFSQHKNLLKGIRTPFLWEHPQSLLQDANVISSLKVLGERGLTFDFCISETHHPGVLSAVADCIQKVRQDQPPDKQTRFVIDHLCNFDIKMALNTDKSRYEAFLAALNELALVENVCIKMSAAIDTFDAQLLQTGFADFCDNPKSPSAARKEMANQMRLLFAPILDAFGLDRAFYGSGENRLKY